MDTLGFFKILVILTSALFAMAQYYESRQSKIIEDGRRRLRNLNFTLAENNESMRDIKKKWDEIQLIVPINNQLIIYTLLLLFVAYIAIFGGYAYSDWSMKLFNFGMEDASIAILRILLIPLFISAVLFLINLKKMVTQLSDFEKKAENICALHQAVSKALGNNNL